MPRPPSAKSLLRNTKRAEPKVPIADEMFLPNQSGDHSAGIVTQTPIKDIDITNKKYVDDVNNLKLDIDGGNANTAIDIQGQNLTTRDIECRFVDALNVNSNNVTATATIQGEQITSTDDATIGNSLTINNNRGTDAGIKMLAVGSGPGGNKNPSYIEWWNGTTALSGYTYTAAGAKYVWGKTKPTDGGDLGNGNWIDLDTGEISFANGNFTVSAVGTITLGPLANFIVPKVLVTETLTLDSDHADAVVFQGDDTGTLMLHIDTIADEMTFGGDVWFTGNGLPFGSFYGNEFNQSQVMTTNTEYQIAHANIATGQSNNITTDGNGKFTIIKAGKYQVIWAITAEHSTVGKHILWGIALDQILQADGQQHRETIATSKEYNISGNGIIDVAIGEDIEIGFKSADGTPGTAMISHMNLNVTQIGG